MLAEQQYAKRIQQSRQRLSRLKKISDVIAWSRLAAIIICILAVWFTWQHSKLIAAIIGFVIMAGFILLVFIDSTNSDQMRQTTTLILINQRELDIAAGKYTNLPGGT